MFQCDYVTQTDILNLYMVCFFLFLHSSSEYTSSSDSILATKTLVLHMRNTATTIAEYEVHNSEKLHGRCSTESLHSGHMWLWDVEYG